MNNLCVHACMKSVIVKVFFFVCVCVRRLYVSKVFV